MVPAPSLDSFQEMFCVQYAIRPSDFCDTVLRLTLYPHARWLTGLDTGKLLAADRSFVVRVGLLRRWRDFAAEAREFQHAPENRRFWRRELHLRVSVRRMQVLFSEVMGGTVAAPPVEIPRAQTSTDPGSLAIG